MTGEIILNTISEALGVIDGEFETELSIHISSSLDVLYQNGLQQPEMPFDVSIDTWDRLLSGNSEDENAKGKSLVIQYVLLRTKIMFDPPPPSSVGYFTAAVDEALWRVRQIYDTDSFEHVNEVIVDEREI